MKLALLVRRAKPAQPALLALLVRRAKPGQPAQPALLAQQVKLARLVLPGLRVLQAQQAPLALPVRQVKLAQLALPVRQVKLAQLVPPAPPAPTGPTGPAAETNAALYSERTTGTSSISPGEAIPFGAVAASGDVSYNSTTRAFALNSAGTYLFIWNVLVDVDSGSADVVLTLTNATGGSIAHSGATAQENANNTLISGAAVVTAIEGEEVTLRNTSGRSIVLEVVSGSTTDGFGAGMTVVRLT